MGCSSSMPQDDNGGDTKGLLANESESSMMNTRNPQPPAGGAGGGSAPTANNGAPQKPVPMTAPINRAQDRITASKESVELELSGIKLRYAYLSQRGQYPDDPFKANQDAFCVETNIARGKTDALFGVFDGHGKDGDGCAIFAKTHLAEHLRNHLDKTKKKCQLPELTKDHIHSCLLDAHVETNKGLHKIPNVDDSLSGTTAISVYFHGRRNRITISNVGDSRAVLGQQGQQPPPESATNPAGEQPEKPRRESPRALKAMPLSRDQTPYRKDERQRIRATGARILSLDQLEGLEPIAEGASETDEVELGEELDEGGDPPRVWHPTGDYPGTAFTRSIGDALAEELGVFAEPEMLTRDLTPDDKIIVVASDGVFEFLTNQSVIDICAKFSDPLEACRAVVAEAYELWLQYELRTDDITMICAFIDEVKVDVNRRGSMESLQMVQAASGVAASVAGEDDDDDHVTNAVVTTEGLRPVRKNVSKEKSKAIEKLKSLHATDQQADQDDVDWRKFISEKTDEEKEGIAEAIKASIMFRNINEEQREMVFACMESVKVKAGTWVIRQGSVGERFYIIDEGRFEVRIVPDGEEDVTGEGGHIVHVYEGSREKNAHPAFGELALMYSAPRSASIVAQSDGHLWALHRSAFRQVLLQSEDHRRDLKKTLGEIPYFQYLDSDGINKLAAIMDETTFGRGENIIEQGKPGETLYVIRSGSCYSVQMLPGETRRANMKAGSYFGDEILSGAERYDMTVVTIHQTTCWQMNCALLKQTMGPLLRGGDS